MGLGGSTLEKNLGPEFPENEHYFGFENVNEKKKNKIKFLEKKLSKIEKKKIQKKI